MSSLAGHAASEDDSQAVNRSCALVLGATGGIGRAYCHALARRKCDLLISGRDTARLATLVEELKSLYAIEVNALPADLCSQMGYQQILSVLREDRSVRWLVNAAGIAQWGRFDTVSPEYEQSMFELNLLAPIGLIRAAIDAFRKKGGGAIVHVASTAAFFSVPYLAGYCATKGALVQWVSAISEECRGETVYLQACCPGFVKTDMFMRAGADAERLPAWIWMSADQVAQASLHAADRKRVICIPGVRYQLMLWFTKWVPASLTRRIAGWLFGDVSKYRLKTSIES